MRTDMTSEEVARYLHDHPEFFDQYAEMLALVTLPDPHTGRAISITEKQLFNLRDKVRTLESKLVELIGFGEENDAIGNKMHRLAVAMIAAKSLQSVLHTLNFHLRDDFSVPHVALRLWNTPDGVEELPEFADVSEELQVFAETLGEPYCGSTSGFETS